MTDTSKLFQSLLVYAVCLPLALILGYIIASPLDLTSLGAIGLVFLVLSAPIILRFHHPLLVFLCNANMVAFFLPAKPKLWLAAALVSLMVSITHRALSQRFRMISVPALTKPFLFLFVLAFVTAQARGGIGFHSMGASTYGGQKYVLLFGGILLYFALTGKRIPAEHARLYVSMFFLGGLTNMIGDLLTFAPAWASYISLLFPAMTGQMSQYGTVRYTGLALGAYAIFGFMLARYGLRGILLDSGLVRKMILPLLALGCLAGGFRSLVLDCCLVFCVMFYLEGLHRTKLLPALTVIILLTSPLTLVFAQHMPLGFQRSISFLPIPLSPSARGDAQDSSEWRVKLWKAVIPQIPQYFLLGKGYAFTARDYEYALSQKDAKMRVASDADQGLALSGDYHNGPLSVIISFGIWGVIAVAWLFVVGFHVLRRNYRYGDPQLRTVNTFLLSAFIMKMFMFTCVVGALNWDIMVFASWLGLSVSLNGGVCSPASEQTLAPGTPIPLRPPRQALNRPA